jgi:hypothetical protein
MRYFALRIERPHGYQTRHSIAHILERKDRGLLLSACGQLTDVPENCIVTEKPAVPVCRSCIRCVELRLTHTGR